MPIGRINISIKGQKYIVFHKVSYTPLAFLFLDQSDKLYHPYFQLISMWLLGTTTSRLSPVFI